MTPAQLVDDALGFLRRMIEHGGPVLIEVVPLRLARICAIPPKLRSTWRIRGRDASVSGCVRK